MQRKVQMEIMVEPSMSVGGQSLINTFPGTAISMYIPFLKSD